jgi:hypothetical protein
MSSLWPNARIAVSVDERWLTAKQKIELQQSRRVVNLLNRQISLFVLRSQEMGIPVGELGEDECIITEEDWEYCLAVE